MSQSPPITLIQAKEALKDLKAIPALIEAMERMSGPALEDLAPIVLDVVKLEYLPRATSTLKRLLALRPAWVNQTEEDYKPCGSAGSNTVLMEAVWLGRLTLVNVLMAAGAKTGHMNQGGLGVLDVAACLDSTPSHQNALGDTLLKKGKFNSLQKDCALYRAASRGNLGMTRSLLAHGAGFSATARSGTALGEACFHVGFNYPALEIVGAMLATAQGRAVIDHGWGKPAPGAPIHSLAYNNAVEVMSMVLAAGATVTAPIELRASNPDTPLMAAARGMAVDAIAMLLSAGADASAVDQEGANALHHLAGSYSISSPWQPEKEIRCIDLLIRAGAHPSLKDGNGQSPLDIAREKGREVMISTLEAIISSNKMKSSTAMTSPPKPIAPQGPRF